MAKNKKASEFINDHYKTASETFAKKVIVEPSKPTKKNKVVEKKVKVLDSDWTKKLDEEELQLAVSILNRASQSETKITSENAHKIARVVLLKDIELKMNSLNEHGTNLANSIIEKLNK